MAVPKTDWPIFDNLDRSWDESAARKRWADYNTKEDGEIDWDSYHKGFFWYDSSDPNKVTSHKLPFVDVINGKPYAIWRAIVAVRQRLGQTQIPAEDKQKVLRELRKYYRKAGKEDLFEKGDVSYRILAADYAHLSVFSGGSKIDLSRRGDVYVLSIRGELNSSDYRRIASLVDIVPEGANVVIDIDSPGGEVLGIDVAESALRRLSERANTVAFTSGMMTSAAYLLGSTARRVYASETALVGSVGVFSVIVSTKRALEKAGVDVLVIRSGDLKTVGHPFDALSEEAVKYVKRRVEHFANYIKTRVMENRNISEEKMKEIATGASFMSAEGKDLGLVDDVSPVAIVEKTVEKEITPRADERLIAFLKELGVEEQLIEKAIEDESVLRGIAQLIKGVQTVREKVDKRQNDDYEKFVLKQLGYEND